MQLYKQTDWISFFSKWIRDIPASSIKDAINIGTHFFFDSIYLRNSKHFEKYYFKGIQIKNGGNFRMMINNDVNHDSQRFTKTAENVPVLSIEKTHMRSNTNSNWAQSALPLWWIKSQTERFILQNRDFRYPLGALYFHSQIVIMGYTWPFENTRNSFCLCFGFSYTFEYE